MSAKIARGPARKRRSKESIATSDTASTQSQPEIILLAVTGMSPAVLTETVWALANPGKNTQPVVPHRVIAITTLPGKARIEEELFKESPDYGNRTVWQALRETIFSRAASGPEDVTFENRLIFDHDIRLISNPDPKRGRSFPLEDIRTPIDNEAAADFIMDEVRRIVENPDTQLVASLAGGRKTMGALLYACLSLLGRRQDRLTHVLVNDPFENPVLAPRFYFPATELVTHQLKDRNGGLISEHRSSEARLELADVPFVRLRNLFPRQLGKFPGRFNALVEAYAEKIEQISGPPRVKLEKDRPALIVNDTLVKVSGREYAIYAFLLERNRQRARTDIAQKECLNDLKEFLPTWVKQFSEFSFQRRVPTDWGSPIEEDLRKVFNSLRSKFRAAGLTPFLGQLLPVKGRLGVQVIC